jgi:hypothetical protein
VKKNRQTVSCDQRYGCFEHLLLHLAGQFRPRPKCCAIVRTPEVFAYFRFLIPKRGVHKHDPPRRQAASSLGNSCFPRTYSTRSRIGFFLMRVNRVSGYPHHRGIDAGGMLAVHRIANKPDSLIGAAAIDVSQPKQVGPILRTILLDGKSAFDLSAYQTTSRLSLA